jgi:hypothetical protein
VKKKDDYDTIVYAVQNEPKTSCSKHRNPKKNNDGTWFWCSIKGDCFNQVQIYNEWCHKYIVTEWPPELLKHVKRAKGVWKVVGWKEVRKMADETKTLTPGSIATTSFADKAKEYEDTSKGIGESEAEVAKAEFALKEWLNENNFGKLVESGKLTDLWDKLVILKPEEEDEVKTAALRKGYGEHVKTLVNSKIGLEHKRTQLKDIKDYIVFLKEIAQLAPRPEKQQQKGGGQQQKGGQQEN